MNITFFFLLFEKFEEDILILLFLIDLFVIFELITILSINYGNYITDDSQLKRWICQHTYCGSILVGIF